MIVGLIGATIGIIAGTSFSVTPVLEQLSAGQLTGQQAGMYFAIAGTSSALLGYRVNRNANPAKRDWLPPKQLPEDGYASKYIS